MSVIFLSRDEIAFERRESANGSNRPLWVTSGLSIQPCHKSAFLGEANDNDAKADVPVGMSVVGGEADVMERASQGPFLAMSGNIIYCLVSLMFRSLRM